MTAELKSRGYKAGAVKHDPPNFEIDHPGKDSYRFTEAGADNMRVSSDNKPAFVKQYRQAPPFEELPENYFPDVDQTARRSTPYLLPPEEQQEEPQIML